MIINLYFANNDIFIKFYWAKRLTPTKACIFTLVGDSRNSFLKGKKNLDIQSVCTATRGLPLGFGFNHPTLTSESKSKLSAYLESQLITDLLRRPTVFKYQSYLFVTDQQQNDMLSFVTSDDVIFDKRLICFLSGLLWNTYQSPNHLKKNIPSQGHSAFMWLLDPFCT